MFCDMLDHFEGIMDRNQIKILNKQLAPTERNPIYTVHGVVGQAHLWFNTMDVMS